MSILFKNASVLMPDLKIKKRYYVGVQGDTIAYLGSSKPDDKYDIVRDFSDKLLMPGLINTHTHVAMTLLRGLGSGCKLQDWLNKYIFPTEDRLIADDVKVATDLAMMEMLSTGTTSFSDMYFFSRETVEQIIKSGMRANVSRSVVSVPGEENWENSSRLKEAIDLFKKYQGEANDRIRVDFSLHAEYTGSNSIAEKLGELCKDECAVFHCHVSETWDEHFQCMTRHGQTPVAWLNELGCLTKNSLLAHCVWISPEDIDLISQSGTSVAHCPTSNMKLGSGFAKTQRMLDKNVNLCLGTDGAASNNNLNMFEEMHLAGVIHNGATRDATIMKAEDILKMSTFNGARAQNRSNVGEIKVGNKADVIAIDLDKPHLVPNLDTPSLLVYSAQGSDVCMTMVDGEILYENGEFKTIDKEKTFSEVEKIARRLYS